MTYCRFQSTQHATTTPSGLMTMRVKMRGHTSLYVSGCP